MAIATQNATYLGGGPTAGGQITNLGGTAGRFSQSLVFTATFTGDGTSTTATLNYIDGTQALSYTPSAILANRTGGNDAGAHAAWVADNNDGGKTATVTFTTAPTSTDTVQIVGLILK